MQLSKWVVSNNFVLEVEEEKGVYDVSHWIFTLEKLISSAFFHNISTQVKLVICIHSCNLPSDQSVLNPPWSQVKLQVMHHVWEIRHEFQSKDRRCNTNLRKQQNDNSPHMIHKWSTKQKGHMKAAMTIAVDLLKQLIWSTFSLKVQSMTTFTCLYFSVCVT